MRVKKIILFLLLIAFVIESLILFKVINLEKIRRFSLTSNKKQKIIAVHRLSISKSIGAGISKPREAGIYGRGAAKAAKHGKTVKSPIENFIDKYISNLKKYPDSLGFSYANLGILALKSRSFNRAINYFKLANKARANDSENLFNLVIAYFKVHKLKDMYKYLSEAYRLNPTDARISELFGYYSYERGKIEAARAPYKMLYKKHNKRSYIMLGNIYMKLKDYGKAVKVYKSALNVSSFPQSIRAAAAFNIANSYFILKDYSRAVKYYNLSVKLGLNDGYFNEGLSLYKLGEFKEAYAAFYRYNKDSADKQFMLGNTFYLLGKYDKAFNKFSGLYASGVRDKALLYNLLMCSYKLKKEDILKQYLAKYEKMTGNIAELVYFYKALGKLYYDNGQYDDALVVYKRASNRFGAEKKGFLYLIARTYEKSTTYEEALKYYNELLPTRRYKDAYYRIAYIEYKIGNIDSAAKVLEKMSRDFGSNADILYLLGDIYYKKHEYPNAIMNFKKIISTYGRTAADTRAVSLSYAKLSGIYDKQSNYESALKSINEAIKIAPTNPGFYYNRAIIYHHSGDLGAAKDSLLTAKSILSKYDEDIYINLGDIYFELGDFKKAKDYYNIVLKKSPNSIEAAYNLNQILKVEGQISK